VGDGRLQRRNPGVLIDGRLRRHDDGARCSRGTQEPIQPIPYGIGTRIPGGIDVRLPVPLTRLSPDFQLGVGGEVEPEIPPDREDLLLEVIG
jgi:hypothetical protein